MTAKDNGRFPSWSRRKQRVGFRGILPGVGIFSKLYMCGRAHKLHTMPQPAAAHCLDEEQGARPRNREV